MTVPSVSSSARGPRVSPSSIAWAASPSASGSSAEESGSVVVSPWKLSLLGLSPSCSQPHSEGAAVLQIATLTAAFTALPVRKHLGRPMRMVLGLHGGPLVQSHRTAPVVSGGLASACWAEGWALGLPSRQCAEHSVLRLELQAVGLFRSTALSFMSIDLAALPVNVPVVHVIDFGFGTLSVQLQLHRRSVNPLATSKSL
eukprot:RCo054993